MAVFSCFYTLGEDFFVNSKDMEPDIDYSYFLSGFRDFIGSIERLRVQFKKL